jgi:AcrR family transcriptional regulator
MVRAMSEELHRRRPVQARSRARVEAILDAADAVFLERGFAQATTRQVAAAAGTSIGSLYRFFPNKEALLVALAERYSQRMQALTAEVTAAGAAPTLAERVSRGVDRFSDFMVANPGLRTLLDNAEHPALREGRAAHDAAIMAMMRASNDRAAPPPPGPEAEAMTAVLYTALTALQVLAVSRDEGFRRRALAETKRLITLYLSDRLGVPPDAPLPG